MRLRLKDIERRKKTGQETSMHDYKRRSLLLLEHSFVLLYVAIEAIKS